MSDDDIFSNINDDSFSDINMDDYEGDGYDGYEEGLRERYTSDDWNE